MALIQWDVLWQLGRVGTGTLVLVPDGGKLIVPNSRTWHEGDPRVSTPHPHRPRPYAADHTHLIANVQQCQQPTSESATTMGRSYTFNCKRSTIHLCPFIPSSYHQPLRSRAG